MMVVLIIKLQHIVTFKLSGKVLSFTLVCDIFEVHLIGKLGTIIHLVSTDIKNLILMNKFILVSFQIYMHSMVHLNLTITHFYFTEYEDSPIYDSNY